MRTSPVLLGIALAVLLTSEVEATKLYEVDLFKDNIIPPAKQASIRSGTCTDDLSPYIQAAIDSISSRGGIITIPTGLYRIDATLILPGNANLYTGTGGGGKPIQLIGSSSFLGGGRDDTPPCYWDPDSSKFVGDWSGTTFVTTQNNFTFISLNLDSSDNVILHDGSIGGWFVGWTIKGIRFEGSSKTHSQSRKAIKGAYVAHGVIEDCAFRSFNAFAPPGGDNAVVDLSYRGSGLSSTPYNENLMFRDLKFTDCAQTCIYSGVSNDNLHVLNCTFYENDQWLAYGFYPTCFLRTAGGATVSLCGGIYTTPFSKTHRCELVDASSTTALDIASVHCEGPSIIARTIDCNNIAIANSYFHVDRPDSSLFTLASVYYSEQEPSSWNHRSFAVTNNTMDLMANELTNIPDDLFLSGLDINNFPLGIFAGNVAYYHANGSLGYAIVPSMRVGRQDLEIDGSSGEVRVKEGLTVGGSVGIGTDSPAEKVDVIGNIRAAGAIVADSVESSGAVSATGGGSGNWLGKGFRLSNDGYLSSSGQDLVQCGQTRPGYPSGKLELLQGGLRFCSSTSYPNTPVERFRVTAAGSVGIGTSSPSTTLHVVGNIRATGTIQVGGGTLSAGAASVGTMVYYVDGSGRHSHFAVCMQTGSGKYEYIDVEDFSW